LQKREYHEPQRIRSLLRAKDETATDQPDGDFFARLLDRRHWDAPWLAAIENIVLGRLRERLM